MKIRCKFQIQEIRETLYGKTYVFIPHYDPAIPEDQVFMKMSPTGRFEIFVTNPVVHAEWKIGSFYYFDAEPVPAKEPAGA